MGLRESLTGSRSDLSHSSRRYILREKPLPEAGDSGLLDLMTTERLQQAVAEFRLRQARASDRQVAIQRYCCDELTRRGVSSSAIEVPLLGAYRMKKWDVGLKVGDEVRLAISCKSIISNHGGTVPNRIDDLLGEAVNLHRQWPRAVIGYLFMMSRVDESVATQKQRAKRRQAGRDEADVLREAQVSGRIWFARLGDSVSSASGRISPEDLPEKFEAVSCSLFGFEEEAPFPVEYHPLTLVPDALFDRLTQLYTERFP